MILPSQILLTLPEWLASLYPPERRYPTDQDKVGLAIMLARRNIEHGSGGPFGAAIFDDQHQLVAVGVNRVVPTHCSLAHAEIMAYMLAQQALGRYRLNEDGRHYVLASSAQPCCQCYGATMWAGIDALLIGARAEDVEALAGFDEGPLPHDWVGELQRRGIAVRCDISREEARQALASYGQHSPRY
jgi:tRNA(Arg) A34 adenosine deaminase TadA